MFTFIIRPGYGSNKLLIEFEKGSGSKEMLIALKETLSSIGVKAKEKEDLWLNDEVAYHMNSDLGEFEISINIWDHVFIMAMENQKAIP